jgi:hypothetical protein
VARDTVGILRTWGAGHYAPHTVLASAAWEPWVLLTEAEIKVAAGGCL